MPIQSITLAFNAISFAIIIEPTNVMTTSNKKSARRLPVNRTSLRARIEKNFIQRRAHTTANVRKRQESVFQSK